ncbi:DUF916 and DUF3324 domain-containing protein [Loigolactobacillus binensis]|uniref:DUF916 and DUF3324 domain-containing protein n=1 Tax=Loigolactobacillus binensis TaxID=2559922 RepID=A0ABW3EDB6_9LACO|nr:DUF916 and DUF3324 domain-containing protein [Loigolactobacillus binensis]
MIKKKTNYQYLILLIGLLLSLFGVSRAVQAADGPDFVLEPDYPQNQIENNGVFNIRVKKGQKQTLTVKVINLSNKARKLTVKPRTAYTTNGGAIDYNRDKAPRDPTLKYSFRNMVKPKKQVVTVPAKGTTTIDFQVKMPNKKFSGLIAGGFHATSNYKNVTHVKNVALTNKYAYVLAAYIRQDSVKAIPAMRLKRIVPGVRGGNPAVLVNLQNYKSAVISGMTIDAKVREQGKKKVIRHSVNKLQQMAPNSNFNYGISWGKHPLKAGKYHLSLTAKMSATLGWKFERDFTITNADANRYNREAGFKPNYLWLWITLAVLIVVLLLILTYVAGRRRSNKKQDE